MSTTKLVKAVIAGAAVGAILGILLAPDKGEKTRKKISNKGTDFKDTLKSKFNDFVDNISGKFEHLKEKGKDALETKIESGKDMAASINSDAKKAMS